MARTRHDARVRAEFTRQAESFASSPALGSRELIEPIRSALGGSAAGRILDLAAGPGIVTAALAPAARQVVALDLTTRTLGLARRRCRDAGHENVQLVCGSALGAPFRSGSFDAAVLRLALHHFEDPGRAFAEAHRALRVGGTLVVLDLLPPDGAADATLLTALERLRDPSHVRTLAHAELRARFAAEGFELSEDRSFSLARRFEEWARIISDPVRTDSLEIVMRELVRRGADAGIRLREEDGELRFDYRFALLAGRRGESRPPEARQ